jgi:hypothetical protein
VALHLLGPWHRYRRWIGTNLEPDFQDAELVVVGANTVNPLDWQRGRISRGDVARICSAFHAPGDGRTHVVAAHHPFAHLPHERKALMRGARGAITALAGCGADIVLCGHLHAWQAEPLGLACEASPAVLLVQAGTGLSTRVRGEENDFNLLRVQPGEAAVERFVARRGQPAFSSAGRARFVRGPGGWQPAGGSELAPSVVTV